MIITNDDTFAEKCLKFRDHGRSNLDCEMWGRNSRLHNLHAAFLNFQFKSFNKTIQRRREVAKLYHKYLVDESNIKLPLFDDDNHFDTFQNFEVLVNKRDQLKEFLAINNIGNIYKKMGRLEEARENFKKVIELQPTYIDSLWNLSASESKIDNAEYWLNEILKIKVNHLPSKLMKAAFRFYMGDKNYFNSLMQSEYSQHPYMRSFSWVFSLQNLPELYFNRWHFFDAIVKKTIISKPFYEFGVWNGASFNYLIKNYKQG